MSNKANDTIEEHKFENKMTKPKIIKDTSKREEIYLLDHKLNYKVFKKIWDSVPDEGPTPIHMDKMVYELMSSGLLYVWFRKGDEDLSITLTPPPSKWVFLIDNPSLLKGKEKR